MQLSGQSHPEVQRVRFADKLLVMIDGRAPDSPDPAFFGGELGWQGYVLEDMSALNGCAAGSHRPFLGRQRCQWCHQHHHETVTDTQGVLVTRSGGTQERGFRRHAVSYGQIARPSIGSEGFYRNLVVVSIH